MDRQGILNLALSLFPYDSVYPQQQEFMQRMISILADGNVGIMESPTGTGKTLSLLCAALAYQLNHLEYETVKENTDLFNEPDWIRESAKHLPMPASNPSPRWNVKKRARTSKKKSLDVDEKINALLNALDSDDGDFRGEAQWMGRKVFFCSRTHSQLSQVMGELSKILKRACSLNIADLHDFAAVTLGSRSNLCINKEVIKLSSVARMNEKCLELQSGASEGTCCPYFNEDKRPSTDLLVDSIKRLQVADIEDMHSLGNKIGACSYYAARQLQADAHFVTIPYNVLLQKETREAFGVNLTDSIVIVDEAHNLIDAINQMNSVSISVETIAKSLKALSAYFDRFSRRLSPQHAQLIQQLIQAMSQLISHGQSMESSRISRINDFTHNSKIDNLNIFPIQAYANESHLSQKICGYYEDGSESRDSNLLNDVIKFIEMLSSSDGDGRVYIRCEQDAVSFKYISLNPEVVFSDVLEQAHSVILAGGTMSPISDYIDQLFGLQYPRVKIKQFTCDHLIPKENCLALPLGAGPTGVPFDFSFANRSSPAMIQELGQTILNMINITPDGIVCFFPSYAYMNQVIDEWTKSSVMTSMKAKRNVIVESSALTSVDSLIESYREAVLRLGSKGGILFGVMGGRLSEGINFSDRLARLVIAVGMPFPNLHDPEMIERINHYIRKKEGAIPSLNKEQTKSDFLENICMRSVNQTLGRVIRHKGDYAAMLLIDQRYSQDRIKNKLSGWIRQCVTESTTFGPNFSHLVKQGAMIRELFNFFLPLPLRWLWFLFYGLVLLKLSYVVLVKYFRIDLMAILRGEDSSDEFDSHTATQDKTFDNLIVYFGGLYMSLLLLVTIFPTPIVPIVIFGAIFCAVLLPLDKFGLSSRYAFLDCLKRVMLNGWRTPTKFKELLLADILTSYSKILADWDALLWCYLLNPLYGNSQISCTPSFLSVLLVCLPYYIRFRQCIGDYRVSGDSKHLWNALKYFTSFPVIYLSFLLNGTTRTNDGYIHLFWIFALSINFTISCLWDILVDWDLGHRDSSDLLLRKGHSYFGLRPSISCHPIIYYGAIMFNCLVRGLWIFRIYFIVCGHKNAIGFMDSDLGIFVAQSLEISRRFVWLLFRTEVQANSQSFKRSLMASNCNILEDLNSPI